MNTNNNIQTAISESVWVAIVLFFCTLCNVYGQQNPDLIVTTTGDSIQCRIINIDAGNIQFRLGEGNLIFIRENEVSSFEYNYFARIQPALPAAVTPAPVESQPKQKHDRDRSVFFLMFSAGAANFGSVSFGDVGGVTMIGAVDAAFFLTSWLKAGVKFNAINTKIDFGDKYTYSDRVMFVAPALYSSFGKNAFKFNICASAGIMNWQLSNQIRNGVTVDNKNSSSIGSSFSVGLSYHFTRKIGMGFNVHTMIGKVTNDAASVGQSAASVERNPSGIGGTIGIFF